MKTYGVDLDAIRARAISTARFMQHVEQRGIALPVPVRLHLGSDVSNLAGEVERLHVAEYLQGPEGCVSGERDCDDYYTADGDDRPDVEQCGHVEPMVATADEAIRLHRIRGFLKAVDAAGAAGAGVHELREQLTELRRLALAELDD